MHWVDPELEAAHHELTDCLRHFHFTLYVGNRERLVLSVLALAIRAINAAHRRLDATPDAPKS